MGKVNAAASERQLHSTYNAQIGPLEAESCEYRFEIVAINAEGTSMGSEWSDAFFT